MTKLAKKIKSNLLTPIASRKPGESLTMSFPDAMKKIIEGKKVARVSWGNNDFCFLDNEWLVVVRNGKSFSWKINDGDMFGEDWVLV